MDIKRIFKSDNGLYVITVQKNGDIGKKVSNIANEKDAAQIKDFVDVFYDFLTT